MNKVIGLDDAETVIVPGETRQETPFCLLASMQRSTGAYAVKIYRPQKIEWDVKP